MRGQGVAMLAPLAYWWEGGELPCWQHECHSASITAKHDIHACSSGILVGRRGVVMFGCDSGSMNVILPVSQPGMTFMLAPLANWWEGGSCHACSSGILVGRRGAATLGCHTGSMDVILPVSQPSMTSMLAPLAY
eukprot:1139354-Pelagomonas_calceolata.AAC.1